MEQEEPRYDHEGKENVERKGNRIVWDLVVDYRGKEPEYTDRS